MQAAMDRRHSVSARRPFTNGLVKGTGMNYVTLIGNGSTRKQDDIYIMNDLLKGWNNKMLI